MHLLYASGGPGTESLRLEISGGQSVSHGRPHSKAKSHRCNGCAWKHFQNISLVDHDKGQQSEVIKSSGGKKHIATDCHIAQREGEAESTDRVHQPLPHGARSLQVSAHWEKPETTVDSPGNVVLFRGLTVTRA